MDIAVRSEQKVHCRRSWVGISTGDDGFLKEVPKMHFTRNASSPFPCALQQYFSVLSKHSRQGVLTVYISVVKEEIGKWTV